MSYNGTQPIFRAVTGTTDTLLASDNGGRISYRSATAVTVTVPNAPIMPDGYIVELEQAGAGQITVVSGGSGVTLASDKLTASYVTARLGASIIIAFVVNAAGTAATVIVKGATA